MPSNYAESTPLSSHADHSHHKLHILHWNRHQLYAAPSALFRILSTDAGSNRPITLQLVSLPPYAADISAATPAQHVRVVRHGIAVRKHAVMVKGEVKCHMYPVSGLPLARSEQRTNGWFLRGARGSILGPCG
jgi:hypothetical protein